MDIKRNIEKLKEDCINKINNAIGTISTSYLEEEMLRYLTRGYHPRTKDDFCKEVSKYFKECYGYKQTFTIPFGVILDGTKPNSKKYKDNKLTVCAVYSPSTFDISYTIKFDRLSNRSLETLVSYAECVVPFTSREDRIQILLGKLSEELTVGTIFKTRQYGNTYYHMVKGTPYYHHEGKRILCKCASIALNTANISAEAPMEITQFEVVSNKDFLAEIEKNENKVSSRYQRESKKLIQGYEKTMKNFRDLKNMLFD